MVEYRAEDSTYYERRRIGNQTIELGMNWIDEDGTATHSYWNIYLTIFNKRKDMYTNMDKKVMTGANPFANAIAAREMFYHVEAELLKRELASGRYLEVSIFCTWVDNRRRDAYYKVLSRYGYDWGTFDGEKCIIKTYSQLDVNPEVLYI